MVTFQEEADAATREEFGRAFDVTEFLMGPRLALTGDFGRQNQAGGAAGEPGR